jgi:hypothetical protein
MAAAHRLSSMCHLSKIVDIDGYALDCLRGRRRTAPVGNISSLLR